MRTTHWKLIGLAWTLFTAFPPTLATAHEATGSRIEEVHGIWVVDLYGSREEMARRHGELVRERLDQTAVPYFAGKIRHSIGNTYIIRDAPWLEPVFSSAIDLVAQEPLRNAIPADDDRMLLAFAQGAGLSAREIRDAWTLPDAGQWLTATLFGKNQVQKGYFGALPAVGALGCSSLIVSSPLSADGLLHARNLDYEGYGIFDRAPALIRYHPSEPGAQQYISLSSLGLHQAGISAMNESGIILTLHQSMVAQTSLRGTPILSINERVIREARSLDQAVGILASVRHSGSWRVLLSSAREDRSLLVEISAQGTYVTEDSRFERPTARAGLLLATNHVLTTELQEDEFSVNYRYAEDTRLRLRALQHLANRELAQKGRIDLQASINIISSGEAFLESGNSTRPTSHGIIAKLNNIQSVVFEPAHNRVWVARAPEGLETAKPLQGQYISLPLFRNSLETPAPQIRESSQKPTLARITAHARYREAAALATEESRFTEAARLYAEAGTLEPAEAIHALMEGLSWFQAGAFEAAELALLRALALNPDRYHRSLLQLFLGRLDDIQGDRTSALTRYASVETGLSRGMTEQVHKHKRKPYKANWARKIVLDAIQADVLRW
jgi:tetratricopeptide (TPR) repeat protein